MYDSKSSVRLSNLCCNTVRHARLAFPLNKACSSAPERNATLLASKLSLHVEVPDACSEQSNLRATKRHVLSGFLAMVAGMVLSAPRAKSEVEGLMSRSLPKAYRETVRQIIKSLRESLAAEANGAPETEVRRKADPAKENVREFVRKWKDDQRVTWHPSHGEILDVIVELGNFYRQNGPRAHIKEDVKTRILQHLSTAEDSLLSKQPVDQEKALLDLIS